MNVEFFVNDYALAWTILFQASPNEEIHKFKRRIWLNYKEEYNKAYKDKELFLMDPKNFIPSNDLIYNTVMESREYEKIRKQTEKYRLEVMSIWDSKKKEINNFVKKMFKRDLGNYKFLVVDKDIQVIDTSKHRDSENTFILGLPIEKKEPNRVILDILIAVFTKEIKNYPLNTEDFKEVIVELAVYSEFGTILSKKSCYRMGNGPLSELKRHLYPYWLMFLGVPKEDFLSFMMRDNIAFDLEKYVYEKELKKMDIEDFIDFCIRNKRYIIRPVSLEVI